MSENHKSKLKIIIAFSILFLVISILLVLIFSAGKKTYTVTYDLNGGTLISGSLEQNITQGQNAVPPVVVKDGAYLHSWSASSNHITKDMTIKAIWEYKTSDGISYKSSDDQNFAEISGAYKHIQGEVYLGAYYGDKKIIGIQKGAFSNCTKITKVYLLDGLMAIEDSAFSGCVSLAEIEIPETVTHLGNKVFQGCSSLEILTLNEGLLDIGANAFMDCTALKEVTIPSTVEVIGANAFAGIEDLVITVSCTKADKPEGWARGWSGDAEVIWIEDPNAESEEDESDSEDEDITDETETEGIKFPSFPIDRPDRWPIFKDDVIIDIENQDIEEKSGNKDAVDEFDTDDIMLAIIDGPNKWPSHKEAS